MMRPNTSKQPLRKEGKQEQKDSVEGNNRIERRAVNITFRAGLSQAQINKIVSENRNTLNQSEWGFHFGVFKNVLDVFDHAKLLLIIALTIHFCKDPKILKEISHISFPKLVSLNLPGNKITSLEPLQGTFLPALKKIFLHGNFLTSLRSLRKCNFRLETLDICENKLITLDGLQQLDTSMLLELWGYNNLISLDWSLMKLQADFKKTKKILFNLTLTVSPYRLQQELISRGAQYVRIQ